MINSMTGYGSTAGAIDGAAYTLQLRTVNNRYLKITIKVPESLAFLEEDIEKLIRRNVYRGTVSYVLRLKDNADGAGVHIDQKQLQTYIERLTEFARANGLDCNIDLTRLASLPGVILPGLPDERQADRFKKDILSATEQAIEKLKEMRAREGQALKEDLTINCDTISKGLEKIRQRSGVVINEYHERLRKRVDELLAQAKLILDGEILAREVAIYADRCDISEEIARLDSHLAQFVQSFKASGHPGRKLDFITQEMLREANTIASKATDKEISQAIIQIKCSIDRLKEQVQNVE